MAALKVIFRFLKKLLHNSKLFTTFHTGLSYCHASKNKNKIVPTTRTDYFLKS